MDNSVRSSGGQVLGYKCWTCGNIFDSMWGETCNKCRQEQKNQNKLLEEIKTLRKQMEIQNAITHPEPHTTPLDTAS